MSPIRRCETDFTEEQPPYRPPWVLYRFVASACGWNDGKQVTKAYTFKWITSTVSSSLEKTVVVEDAEGSRDIESIEFAIISLMCVLNDTYRAMYEKVTRVRGTPSAQKDALFNQRLHMDKKEREKESSDEQMDQKNMLLVSLAMLVFTLGGYLAGAEGGTLEKIRPYLAEAVERVNIKTRRAKARPSSTTWVRTAIEHVIGDANGDGLGKDAFSTVASVMSIIDDRVRSHAHAFDGSEPAAAAAAVKEKRSNSNETAFVVSTALGRAACSMIERLGWSFEHSSEEIARVMACTRIRGKTPKQIKALSAQQVKLPIANIVHMPVGVSPEMAAIEQLMTNLGLPPVPTAFERERNAPSVITKATVLKRRAACRPPPARRFAFNKRLDSMRDAGVKKTKTRGASAGGASLPRIPKVPRVASELSALDVLVNIDEFF